MLFLCKIVKIEQPVNILHKIIKINFIMCNRFLKIFFSTKSHKVMDGFYYEIKMFLLF